MLVRFDPSEDGERPSESGMLVIPGGQVENIYQWGTVLRVGPGMWSKKGAVRVATGVHPGDRVLFIRFLKNTHSGEALRASGHLGDSHFMIRASDVVALEDQDRPS